MPDPLADARALLTVVELLYRARRSAGLHGVETSERAARAMVPLGARLRAAVAAAEASAEGTVERAAALADVARLGELVWQSIDDRREGVRSLLEAALAGVKGQRDRRPG